MCGKITYEFDGEPVKTVSKIENKVESGTSAYIRYRYSATVLTANA